MAKINSLKIIWKDDNLKQIKDDNLANQDLEIFQFDKDLKDKIMFIKPNVTIEVKQKFFYGITAIGVCLLLLFLIAEFSEGGSFLVKIGVVLLIGSFVIALGVIAIPFTTVKRIIFDLEFGSIQKQNAINVSSSCLDLSTIKRIVFNHDIKKTYVTFRQHVADEISKGSPIFVLENDEEKNQFEEFITTNISDKISVVHLR
ncbi:hypothetical protein [Flavobacterium sp. 7A]|uniref:hypothetical protein n=1 Tax=Flavobacterium sp. 7A TaxID=2940571 RepID=UPI00222621CE|nr:hypothetical protein [Flavobacterium sp. 7A]MCW2120606.1 hypothetical protein [Flavobacterium sp. 7A]